jgi:hypothetical protein
LDQRPVGIELHLAQRYFAKSFNQGIAAAQNVGSGTGEYYLPCFQGGANWNYGITYTFPVPMRAAPVMTIYNPYASNNQIHDTATAGDCSSSSGVVSGASGFRVQCVQDGSAAAGYLPGYHWTADARF